MTQTFMDPCREAQKGSLLTYVQAFVEQQRDQGYAAASVKESTRLVKDFAGWFGQHGIDGPSLSATHVAAHVLRHTMAMELLQAGVERSVIALWLGHESIETTQIYLDANLEMKQAALDKVDPQPGRVGRFRPDDQLLAFLNAL